MDAKKASLAGTLTTGLGEGAYYMGLTQYQEQFKRLVGFLPFAGTLNLKTSPKLAQEFLALRSHLTIEGFASENRTFGGLKAYPVEIKGVKGALIIPDRTSHDHSIVEVIAPMNLRAHLSISDGDTVVIA